MAFAFHRSRKLLFRFNLNLARHLVYISSRCFLISNSFLLAPPVGFEPTTNGLEIHCAIHCATGAMLYSAFTEYAIIVALTTIFFAPDINFSIQRINIIVERSGFEPEYLSLVALACYAYRPLFHPA